MTKQVQRRRGTATQHTSFTGAEGELSVNTTNKSVHVHDGVTTGGIEAARADMTNVSDADLNARLTGNTLSALTITSADINGGTIDGTVIGGASAAAVTATALTATSSATLQHSASTKLATTSTGVDVTGTVTADGLTVDGTSSLNGDIAMNTGTPELRMYSPTSVNGYALLSNVSDTVDGGLSIKDVSGNVLANFKSNGDISFYEDTGTTAKLFWDASAESLGIGGSPSAKLEVSGPAASGYGQFVIKSDTTPQMTWYQNTTLEANAYADGTKMVLGSVTSTPLVLRTGGSERMRIDASGNVGIGTSSPSSALTVRSTDATIRLEDSDLPSGAYGLLRAYDGGMSLEADASSVQSNSYIRFAVDNSERLRIDASGRVGIGTSSPLAALHVTTSTTDYTGDVVISGTRPYLVFDDTTAGQNGFSIGVDGGAVTFGQGDFSTNSNVYGTERMRIDASGNLLVGTTSTNLASGALYLVPGTNAELGIGHASAASSGSTFVAFRHNNTGIGSITQSGTTGVSYNTSSDYRLKEDWQPMTGASERVLALKPVNFAWKADGTRVDGFLAHEAQEIVPEAVHGVKDGMRIEEYEVTPAVYDDEGNLVSEAVMGTREVPVYQGIDQSKLVPLLTAALQEALKRIEALEAQLNP